MKKFRLIGRTTEFFVTGHRWILSGTVEVVDGRTACGGYRTTARVVDVLAL